MDNYSARDHIIFTLLDIADNDLISDSEYEWLREAIDRTHFKDEDTK